MVSHSRDELYRFSEELFVVKHGEILRQGETKDVFKDPVRIEVARMTGCKNFSAAKIINNHTIEATDWGITLNFRNEIPGWLGHIGYRAHYFEPVWGEREENCISFDLTRVDDLPFEKNYYIRPECNASEEDFLCWFVQGEEQRIIEKRGLPDYLRLTEENILMLK